MTLQVTKICVSCNIYYQLMYIQLSKIIILYMLLSQKDAQAIDLCAGTGL